MMEPEREAETTPAPVTQLPRNRHEWRRWAKLTLPRRERRKTRRFAARVRAAVQAWNLELMEDLEKMA
jgi:hypothetical protein